MLRCAAPTEGTKGLRGTWKAALPLPLPLPLLPEAAPVGLVCTPGVLCADPFAAPTPPGVEADAAGVLLAAVTCCSAWALTLSPAADLPLP